MKKIPKELSLLQQRQRLEHEWIQITHKSKPYKAKGEVRTHVNAVLRKTLKGQKRTLKAGTRISFDAVVLDTTKCEKVEGGYTRAEFYFFDEMKYYAETHSTLINGRWYCISHSQFPVNTPDLGYRGVSYLYYQRSADTLKGLALEIAQVYANWYTGF